MTVFNKMVLCVLLLTAVVNSVRAEIRLVANPWPPYTGERMLNGGVATEIVRTALERAGYETTFEVVPWSRALNGSQNGAYDLLVCAWQSVERQQVFRLSDAYIENRIVFLRRAGSTWKYHDLKTLSGMRVGVVRDYAYGDAFNSAENFVRDPSGDFLTNVRKLVSGRVDLTLEDEYVARFEIARDLAHLREKVDYSPVPLSTNTCHAAITRKHPQGANVIAAMNRELAEMRSEELLAQILLKHGLTSVPGR